jgi:glutamate racemase
MRIGIFDSGIGGLVIAKSLIDELPDYDYLYLGDTARVPYGDRSKEEVYEFTKQAVHYLLEQDCKLVILACNTASAEALRKIQQEYLPVHYPERKVLGVIIPTVEATLTNAKINRIGIFATRGTVQSKTYVKELRKMREGIYIVQFATPELVPLIEEHNLPKIQQVLAHYLQKTAIHKLDSLILGCTHYAFIKDVVRELANDLTIISPDEIMPTKLARYLAKHDEITSVLTKNEQRDYLLTAHSSHFNTISKKLFGSPLSPRIVSID